MLVIVVRLTSWLRALMKVITSRQEFGDDIARHTKMLGDIRAWSSDNPNPSNLFLIMGDPSVDFLPYIEFLKSSKGYKIHYIYI
ncbi:hypothetical protein F2Q69_00009227 [Brassica cretica]|uniref:Phosphatidate phosphatase APP1 catalytic domain-containing protein n=1 Tax=Brassica cretica TaxID=69181 RepID=A0A8S9PIA1_BRACR|nr:hypothetical protein F2Q69_00009227 [Brassica cretica]